MTLLNAMQTTDYNAQGKIVALEKRVAALEKLVARLMQHPNA